MSLANSITRKLRELVLPWILSHRAIPSLCLSVLCLVHEELSSKEQGDHQA